MNKIVEFPSHKSRRVALEQKVNTQRAFLTLSLFAFILLAVMSNEQVTQKYRPVYVVSDNSRIGIEQVNRAIASAQPVNLFRDVEWEHSLAKKLADRGERLPASIGSSSLSEIDHLRYGVLAGKYRIISAADGASLKEVEYIDSLEISDRPVYIKDRQSFLSEHRALFHHEVDAFVIKSKVAGDETWSLMSKAGAELGSVQFKLTDEDQFLGLKVQSPGALETQSAQ